MTRQVTLERVPRLHFSTDDKRVKGTPMNVCFSIAFDGEDERADVLFDPFAGGSA